MRALLLCCVLLTGCESLKALLPVAVSCVPREAPMMPPVLPDSDLRRLPDDTLVLTIAAERLDLLRYGKLAEAVISGCR